MQHIPHIAPRRAPDRGLCGRGALKAFTLVEVMVATVLLTMIILGILSVLIGSYRLAAKARYNDHARYIVKSFADQFLTQQSTDSTTGATLPLFIIAANAAQTTCGMTWTNSDGSVASGGSDITAAPPSITVLLGDNTGSPIQANLWRQTWYVYSTGASIGEQTATPQNNSAGYLLRSDFTISYSFLNVPLPPLTVSVIRSIP